MFFFNSESSLRYNLWLFVESENSQNQHTQSYSYAGNSNKYQVFGIQQTFNTENLIKVWLRNENQNLPVPTKSADVMVLFEAV